MSAAQRIQADREAADLARHKERLEWLQATERPCWADGTPVDCHMRNVLLKQSLAYVAKATGQQGGAA